MNVLFCIANLLKVGRKKIFFWKVYGFEPPPSQNEVKHNKCQMSLKLVNSQKAKKNRIKVCNLSKAKLKAKLPPENADIRWL